MLWRSPAASARLPNATGYGSRRPPAVRAAGDRALQMEAENRVD